MKAYTIREEGTDSPNIGTIGLGDVTNVEDMLVKLNRNLLEHYDAEVTVTPEDINFDMLYGRGSCELEIEVDSEPNYTTVLTLETTYIY